MHANSILALTGVLSVVAAVPFSGNQHQHHQHHQHHKRMLVWETVTEEVVQTIPVTKTIWLEPGETPPTAQEKPHHYNAPKHSAHTPPAAPVAPAYTPAASPAAPAYTPPVESPAAPAYTAPAEPPAAPAYTPPAEPPAAPAYTPPAEPPAAPAEPVYTSPAPPAYTPPSSPYVAPVPSSTYVPPPAPVAPSSSVAPASSAPAYEGSTSGWQVDMSLPADAPSGLSSGMGKSGTTYTGDLTFYGIGMGACGFSNTEEEAVVAISQNIFDSYDDGGNPNNNPLCGKYVTITDTQGNKRYHKIVDRCTGCADADLDLPEGFFNVITAGGNGRVGGMEWCFT